MVTRRVSKAVQRGLADAAGYQGSQPALKWLQLLFPVFDWHPKTPSGKLNLKTRAGNPKEKTTRPRFRKRYILLAFFCLLIVGVVFGWRFVKQEVRSQLESQLIKLDLGLVDIEEVGLTGNGIFAKEIEFTRPGRDEPWLTVKRLAVMEPIWNLIQGESQYDQIMINGSRLIIDLDDAQWRANEQDSSGFDFRQFKMPAENIKLDDAAVVIRQSGRTDFDIKDLDLKLTKTEQSIQVKGTARILDGKTVAVSGALQPAADQLALTIQSNEIEIVQGEWRTWPGVPDYVHKYVSASGLLKFDAEILKKPNQAPTFSATVQPKSVDVMLHYFDLPFNIDSGLLTLMADSLTFDKINATTGDGEKIVANGTTTVGSFPVVTRFSATLVDVSDATLRKLVPDIPLEVTAHTDGTAKGEVVVENSWAMRFKLTADTTSDDLKYGEIAADRSLLNVDLQSLELTPEFEVARLEGTVGVNSTVTEEPLENVFQTFELKDLQDEMGLQADASGTVVLKLPLETINELRTWTLAIKTDASTAQLRGQPINRLSTDTGLDQGRLKLDASFVDPPLEKESVGKFEVLVDWPITDLADDPKIGRIDVDGVSISPDWMIRVANFQSQVAGGETDKAHVTGEGDVELHGRLNLQSSIALSSEHPDDVQTWNFDGTVVDSIIILADERLEDFGVAFTARNGELKLFDGTGKFASGGEVAGSAIVSLVKMTLESTTLDARDIPLTWAAGLASRLNTDTKEWLAQADISTDPVTGELAGNFSARLKLKPTSESPSGLRDFDVEASVGSQQLKLKDYVFNNIKINGQIKNDILSVSQFDTTLDSGGRVSGSGTWNIESDEAAGNLSWGDVPADWLAGLAGQNADSLKGTVSGDINLTSVAAERTDAEFPIRLSGSIAVEKISAGGITPQSFQFDVTTKKSVLHLSRFRAVEGETDWGLAGSVDLVAPHKFTGNVTMESLNVREILKSGIIGSELNQQIGEVSGKITSAFKVSGNLEPFDWATSGDATMENVFYQDRPLNNVSARWSHMGADWAQSQAELSIFGGKLKMTELVSSPQRVAVEVENIDAEQLTALGDLPVELTGTLSGNASLNEWSLEETRWIDINLRGASTNTRYGEFGDLAGHLKYQNRKFDYGLKGQLLDGSFESLGETSVADEGLTETKFPIEASWKGAKLGQLHRSSKYFRSLRGLEGEMYVNAAIELSLNESPTGKGRFGVENLKWNRELLTRRASTEISLGTDSIEISDIRADLKQGEISGRAQIPIGGVSGGRYELGIRKFDLARLAGIVLEDESLMQGLFDARITGQFGSTISGRGEIGLARAEFFGLAGQSFKLPVEFKIDPVSQRGRIEMRRTQVRLFQGRVSGKAAIDFGNSLNVDVDTSISNLETGDLFKFFTGAQNQSQGRLNGRLVLNGRGIRSGRDLKGSFKGDLDRVPSFKLPLLKDLAVFLGSRAVINQSYDSKDIELKLSNGAIEVKKLNFSSSLAKIAITGKAYLDQRLDLSVAARIEQLNQPSLIDEFTQSPLVRFSGTPIGFFAQAASFLSDRIVFVNVNGTAARPVFRLDSGQQVREELVRYFLSDANIPALSANPNN